MAPSLVAMDRNLCVVEVFDKHCCCCCCNCNRPTLVDQTYSVAQNVVHHHGQYVDPLDYLKRLAGMLCMCS